MLARRRQQRGAVVHARCGPDIPPDATGGQSQLMIRLNFDLDLPMQMK